MSKLGAYAGSTSESDAGRSETPHERLDRNLEELTGELRVIVTGVQVPVCAPARLSVQQRLLAHAA